MCECREKEDAQGQDPPRGAEQRKLRGGGLAEPPHLWGPAEPPGPGDLQVLALKSRALGRGSGLGLGVGRQRQQGTHSEGP